LFGPGNLNYDKIFERGTTRLWVILIMARENYRKASLNLKRALWGDKPEGLLPENCPNFSFFFCLGRDKPQRGRKNFSFFRESFLWEKNKLK
jgi:hypothetical protein